MREATQNVLQSLIIDDDGRACRDIADEACQQQPRNIGVHTSSLALSKGADGLVDPKLVLSWLMTALGAPAVLLGLLVPVREAGALLPQLFIAGAVRRLQQRKWVWTAGALVQGASALAIAGVAMMSEGAVAGGAIVGLLALLAIARSACSVSYKDVLGKTVAKAQRGRVTGLASSAASSLIVVFALILVFDLVPRFDAIITALLLAGAFWIAAGCVFLVLKEPQGSTEGGANAFAVAQANLRYLVTDKQLRLFIGVRGLLTATALAPPFMLAAVQTGGVDYSAFGFLLLASAAASFASSYIWGRFSDQSSRRVLIVAAFLSAVSLAATSALAVLGVLDIGPVLPVLLFALMTAYQGVRLGRSTHVVDMTTQDKRAAYTALSNTAVGLILLTGALFGVAAQLVGVEAVLGFMAVLCLIAGGLAFRLEEVQVAEGQAA